jgi:ABC-type glycerol-3-phosphate transport system substrate-binding protein
MMQNGLDLPVKKGVVAKFDEGVVGADGNVVQAGEQALGYYTQFAKLNTVSNTMNPFYTWNSRNHNSIDAFAEGTVAMMFNYSWQIAELKSKNPKLNFAITNVPQVDATKPVTYANYWGYAVARNKVAAVSNVGGQATSAPVSNETRTHEAWQFLRFLTLKNTGTITLFNAITKNSKDFPISFDPAIDYLKRTNQPAARRDIIELQKIDTNLGAFATGNLIAKHWYQTDPSAIERIFVDMIESINRGDTSLHEALVMTRNRVSYLAGATVAK